MDAFYPSKNSGEESGLNGRYGIFLYLFSIVLHLAFIAGFFFFENLSPQRALPVSIKVDLVSMTSPGLKETPGEAAESSSVKSAAKKRKVKSPKPEPVKPVIEEQKVTLPEPEPEPEPEPVKPVVPEPEPVKPVIKEKEVKLPEPEPVKPVEEPAVIVPSKKDPQPKPVTKEALKKKTYSSEKVLESARESVEKSLAEKKKNLADSADSQEENTLDDAFSRLKEKVAKQGGSRAVTNITGAGVNGDKTDYEPIDLYNLELMYRVQQNWAFNERLAKADRGLEARLLIKILQNGQIRDIWFETRSGNSYLDESALKAVKKSAPLPPLPKGYASYDIGLIFTPSGLK